MPFQPEVNQEIQIDNGTYRFLEHPLARGIPYGQEGRQAIVYQLSDGHNRRALKVFKAHYRFPALVSLSNRLEAFADLPGLIVCRRTVLTPRHAALLRQYPELTYSVLMPWIPGPTWMEVLMEKRALSLDNSLALTQSMLEILTTMEQHKIAHCDISGSNVLLPGLLDQGTEGTEGTEGTRGTRPVSPSSPGHPVTWSPGHLVTLVDVEQLYSPNLSRPQVLAVGTPGYNHPQATTEQFWSPYADRFAGAVLLAEMLGWCDERVREAAWGENYFDSAEMQQDTDSYRLLLAVLRERWGARIAGLLERAWHSQSLADCGTFQEWSDALQRRDQPASVSTSRDSTAELTRSREEARSQAYELAAGGDWQGLLNLCQAILSQWPDQGDITLLMSRAQRLIALDQEIEQTWARARQSSRVQDWEACWRAVRTVLQQSPQTPRYQQMATQAEQEMNWAALVARAGALLAARRLDEVQSLLAKVPEDHPGAVRVRTQMDIERDKDYRLAELLRQTREAVARNDWEEALRTGQMGLALDSANLALQSLLADIQREREVEARVGEYSRAAMQATQAGDWGQAVDRIEQALALRPKRVDLQAQREQWLAYRGWAGKITQAQDLLRTYDWAKALTLLTDIPADFQQAGELQAQARLELQRQQELEKARRAYNPGRVLSLLADAPPGYPNLHSWRRWAETESQRQQELQAARQTYDGQRILDLLADVPDDYPQGKDLRRWAQVEAERRKAILDARRVYDPEQMLRAVTGVPADYPQLAELRQWAQVERERRSRLQAAKAAFDGELLLAVLADVPDDYPRVGELRRWAQAEIQRGQQLQAARAAYDARRVLDLLAEIPAGVPQAETLRQWAQQQLRRQEQLQAARQTFDPRQVLALLADAPEDDPRREEFRRWAQLEIDRREQLEAAQRAHDGQRVLALLADTPPEYPQRQELQRWAQAEIDLDQALQAARQAHDARRVLQLLADRPAGDPHVEDLRHWAAQEVHRQEQLQVAQQAYDGAQVLALLAHVPADYPQVEELRCWAQDELDRQRCLDEARRRYDGQRALDLLAGVPDDYPQLAEYREWAQQEINRQQAVADACRTYDAQRVLALLADAPADYSLAATQLPVVMAHPAGQGAGDRLPVSRLRVWAQVELERQNQLAAARQSYNPRGVLALLADVPAEYPQAVGLRQWAEAEIERQDQLAIAQREYDLESVANLLSTAPADFPGAEELSSWLATETERRRRLTAARQADHSEQVIDLLVDVGPEYPQLEELRNWAWAETERRKLVETARSVYDGEWVLALLAEASPDAPWVQEARQWAEAECWHRQELQLARRQFDLDRLRSLLAEVPVGYPPEEDIRRWVARETERRRSLAEARRIWNVEGVLALLADVPPEYPDLADLLQWAQIELERQRALAEARRGYDVHRVLALLAHAPADDPHTAEYRDWAESTLAFQKQLAEARRSYDGERVLALLSGAPADLPNLDTWRRWAQMEIERRHGLEIARQAYDGESILALLADVSSDYTLPDHLAPIIDGPQPAEPARVAGDITQGPGGTVSGAFQVEDLRIWAQHEIERRRAIEQAGQGYELDRLPALLVDVPPDYPVIAPGASEVTGNWLRRLAPSVQRADELRQWVQLEMDRRKQVQQARNQYDAERVLSLLANAPPQDPQLAGMRNWAEETRQVQAQLCAARQARRWAEVLTLLAPLPADFPDRSALLDQATQALEQQKPTGQAEPAVPAAQGPETLVVAEQVVAQPETQTNQAVTEALAEAERWLQAGNLEQGLVFLEHARSLDPNRADIQARCTQVWAEWERSQQMPADGISDAVPVPAHPEPDSRRLGQRLRRLLPWR